MAPDALWHPRFHDVLLTAQVLLVRFLRRSSLHGIVSRAVTVLAAGN